MVGKHVITALAAKVDASVQSPIRELHSSVHHHSLMWKVVVLWEASQTTSAWSADRQTPHHVEKSPLPLELSLCDAEDKKKCWLG